MLYQNIVLFDGMTRPDINQLISSVIYQKKKFNKGNIIVSTGTEIINLRAILKGSVHTEMLGENDKIINIAKINAGEIIAISFLFGDSKCIPVDVIADEDTEILIFPKDSIKTMIKKNELFSINFITQISNQTLFLSQKIRLLNLSSLREKIFFYIQQQQRKQNSDWVKLNKTQQQMAENFGVARPSFARVLKEMTESGIISFDQDKKVRINQ